MVCVDLSPDKTRWKSLQINKKNVLTDHLYTLMKISIMMGVVSSRMIMSLSTGDKGSLNMVCYKSYAMSFTVTKYHPD